MDFQGFGRSETGDVRAVNEDSYWVGEQWGVFVLADGMGGKEEGERASAALVDEVADRAEQLCELLDEDDPARDHRHRMRVHDYLRRIIGQINSELYDQGGGEMGTTCELLALSGESGFVAHVGDSRTYLLRNERAHQLTDDHTFAEQLRRQREEFGLRSDRRIETQYEHVLTRSVGGKPEIDIDTLFVDVQPGDRFLLCSDGVTDVLESEQLFDAMGSGEVEEFADRVVTRALEVGSTDNATSLVVAVSDAADERAFDEDSPVDTLRKISFLEQVELFEGLDERELMKILRVVYKRRYSDGETIIERNDEAEQLFMLLEGHVELEIEGHEVARLSPGAHFGEMALFGSAPRSANAIADGDVVLLAVPAGQFRRLVEREDIQLGNKLLRNLLQHAAARIRETTLELLDARGRPEDKAKALGTAHTLELDVTEAAEESPEE